MREYEVQSNQQITSICNFSWKICTAQNSQSLSRGRKKKKKKKIESPGLRELGYIGYLQLPKHQLNHTAT
jgi:hypothetical protein